jgi:hypothetical protein
MKKMLLASFISVYFATLFGHFLNLHTYILEMLSNNYAYEDPCLKRLASKSNTVKQSTEKDVTSGLYFDSLNDFI